MNNERNSKELFYYLIAGILTTIVNFIVYYFMIYLSINYKISNTIAFIMSVIFAFIVNKKYVFFSNKGYLTEFIKFIIGRLFTYIIDIGFMILLIEYMHVSEYISKVWTNILVVMANYFISKFWTFK